MSFKVNPLNFDLISLHNEQGLINRSIRNLVLTNRGEKFFQPLFGSNVYNSLFENIDNLSVALKDTIVNLIANNEPRVKLNPQNGVLVKVNLEQKRI